jgi:hypothetical protein
MFAYEIMIHVLMLVMSSQARLKVKDAAADKEFNRKIFAAEDPEIAG